MTPVKTHGSPNIGIDGKKKKTVFKKENLFGKCEFMHSFLERFLEVSI